MNNYPLVDYLLSRTTPKLPKKEIIKLSEGIGRDKALATECLKLVQAEIAAGNNARGCAMVWLAFALALARDLAAMQAFLDIQRRFDMEEDISFPHYQLAISCLQMYGDELLTEMLDRPCLDWKDENILSFLKNLRVVSHSGDEILRRRVAEEVERLLKECKLDLEAMQLCCELLAVSSPERAGEVIPTYHGKCLDPRRVTKILESVRRRGDARNFFHESWQNLAKKNAILVHYAFKTGNLGLEEEEEEEEIDDDEARERCMEWIASFEKSQRFRDLSPDIQEEAADDLQMILGYLWGYTHSLPEEATAGDIGYLMTNVLPRKVSAEIEWFNNCPRVLNAFFSFLGDIQVNPDVPDILMTIKTHTPRMLERAGDPTFWGLAKSIVMKMKKDGVDITDEAAKYSWIQKYNLEQMASRRGESPMGYQEEMGISSPGESSYFPSWEASSVDKTVTPDPYEPCHCGSGKKYKWCCRENDRKKRRSQAGPSH